MTIRSPTYLKGRFENGDTPSATDFEDIFDSYFSLATSASQTIEGRVTFQNQIIASEVISPLVSATSVIASFVSAQTANVANISSTVVSAVTVSGGTIYANTLNANNGNLDLTRVSASTVSARDIHADRKITFGYQDLLPTGIVQASAATAVYDVTNIFVSASVPNERAVIVGEFHPSRIQYIINNPLSATVATVYPWFGCNFIGTAANGGLLLAAGETIQIIHVNSSAYAWVRY